MNLKGYEAVQWRMYKFSFFVIVSYALFTSSSSLAPVLNIIGFPVSDNFS